MKENLRCGPKSKETFRLGCSQLLDLNRLYCTYHNSIFVCFGGFLQDLFSTLKFKVGNKGVKNNKTMEVFLRFLSRSTVIYIFFSLDKKINRRLQLTLNE